MNTDSNIFPRNHNNTTTAKNMSSLDAFISPNSKISMMNIEELKNKHEF